MDDRERKLRLTLEEIERLLAAAERLGAPVEPWVEHLAAELRSSMPPAPPAPPPEPAFDDGDVADRMRSDPRRSMGAQAHVDRNLIQMLKS